MVKGVCPKCGSINNLSLISIESSNCICNSCYYTDSFRVFHKIKVGDILEIENKVYLLKDDGLYQLQKQVLNTCTHKIKKLGDIVSNPEFLYS